VSGPQAVLLTLAAVAALPVLSVPDGRAGPQTPANFRRTTLMFLRPGMSGAELDAYADTFARSGVTGVLIGGGRHHYLYDDLPHLDGYAAAAARLVEACRRRGISVAEHHSAVLTTRRDLVEQRRDWIQKDFETGEASVWPEYRTWAFCPNNPGFREDYWKTASSLVRRIGADALMSDDTVFHHGCSCEACARRWREETGGDIRQGWEASRTPGTPAWRQWHAVRRKWFGDFRRWLLERQRRELPGTLCLALTGNALSPWGGQTHGGAAEGSLDTADIAVWEVYNPADFYSWRRLSVEAAVMAEAARLRGVTALFLPYADTAESRDVFDPGEETFAWGLGQAHGLPFVLGRVYLTGLTPEDEPRDYFLFERDRLSRWLEGGTQPRGEAAVLFSRSSRDLDTDWEASHVAPAIGWAQSLQDALVPWRAITEDTLDNGVPEGVRVVVAANVFALSGRHLDALERFVRAGGTLIATSRTAFFDAGGASALHSRRSRLESLYGLSLGNPGDAIAGPVPVQAAGAREMEAPVPAFRHRAGRGEVIYLPAEPGRMVFQDFQNEGRPFTGPGDRELAAGLADMVRRLPGECEVSLSLQPHASALTTVRGRGRDLLVFFLNTAGASLPPGSDVPTPSRVDWKRTGSTLQLRFSRAPRRVYVVSLDFTESRVLERPGQNVSIPAPRRFALIVAEMPED